MLIQTLAPSLSKFRMKIDLAITDDGLVSLTIVPAPVKGEPNKDAPALLTRPINLIGTPEELDAELGKGEAGALASIFATRRTLAQQLEDDAAAAQAELAASRAKAAEKAAAAKKKPAPTTGPTATPKPAEKSALDFDDEADPEAPAATASTPAPANGQGDEISLF